MTDGLKRLALYAGLALGALLLWNGYKAHLRNDGALREQAKALEARNARLEDEAGRVDTVYAKQAVTVVRWRTRYDTLLKNLPETLTVAPPVKEILTAADSTINACSVALQTCEQRVALRNQRIAVLDSLLTVERKRQPGFIRRTFGCTAGVAATTQGAGLGASCGVRFP